MELEAALIQAYHSWARTGVADVPDFDPVQANDDETARKLAMLDEVSPRCVISKVQAAWLRKTTN